MKTKNNDLVGRRFGMLTVLEDSGKRQGNSILWRCRCDCGGEKLAVRHSLTSGAVDNCGCVPRKPRPRINDLTGQRFGRLLVLHQAKGSRKAVWHCRCDCGNEVDVFGDNLLRGLTRSCGCWNREQSTRMHDHMHYQDDTCVERLKRVHSAARVSKAGFRGLFLTKSGKYRVMITFRKVHYNLGYYPTFAEAVRVRLDAEDRLHNGYLNAFRQYGERAESDPEWARDNPFYYDVMRKNGDFEVSTNGI